MIGSEPQPQHWLVPMARFGLNPFGEPRYRVVFAPSVRLLVCGAFAAGPAEQFRKKYQAVGKYWIMEAWQTPGVSRETWERGLSILGPYPSRGFYDWCYTFYGSPDNFDLEKIVAMIEAGPKRYSYAENCAAMHAEYDRETQASRNTAKDQLWDALPAFIDAPISARGGNRGTKTNDFRFGPPRGLPRPGGVIAGPKRGVNANH